MGGASSEIDDATTEVALEMAWFEPVAIATTAARLGLRSEASARFERGVDPMVADRAIARFVELLRETSPAAAAAPGLVDARGDLPGAGRGAGAARAGQRAARHGRSRWPTSPR